MRLPNLAALSAASAIWIVTGAGCASDRGPGPVPSLDPKSVAYVEFVQGHEAYEPGKPSGTEAFYICATPECDRYTGSATFNFLAKSVKLKNIPAGVTVIRGLAIRSAYGSDLVGRRGLVMRECSLTLKFTAAPGHTYRVGIVNDEAIPKCNTSVTDKSSGEEAATEFSPWVRRK